MFGLLFLFHARDFLIRNIFFSDAIKSKANIFIYNTQDKLTFL